MYGVEAAAEQADIHSDIPAMFLRCPASFVVAGHCGKSRSQTDYELCSLIADLYQRVLRKASYEIRL
jgi:hypothetical protein